MHRSESLKETHKLAGTFLKKLKVQKEATVIGLSGDLGSGKTSFVQAVTKEFGITEHVTSPTFVIMKKYGIEHAHFNNFNTLVHIDAYRLESGAELAALAFSGIVGNPKNIIFIEWPERVKEVLPKNIIMIEFAFISENEREINIKNF